VTSFGVPKTVTVKSNKSFTRKLHADYMLDNYGYNGIQPDNNIRRYSKNYEQMQEEPVDNTRVFKLLLLTINMASKTPEVPAIFVGDVTRTRLRVEYDDVVQFSDLVVARVSSERVSEIPSKCVYNTPFVLFI